MGDDTAARIADVDVLADVIGTRNSLGTVWVASPQARQKVAEIILASDWLAAVVAQAKAEGAQAVLDAVETYGDVAGIRAARAARASCGGGGNRG